MLQESFLVGIKLGERAKPHVPGFYLGNSLMQLPRVATPGEAGDTAASCGFLHLQVLWLLTTIRIGLFGSDVPSAVVPRVNLCVYFSQGGETAATQPKTSHEANKWIILMRHRSLPGISKNNCRHHLFFVHENHLVFFGMFHDKYIYFSQIMTQLWCKTLSHVFKWQIIFYKSHFWQTNDDGFLWQRCTMWKMNCSPLINQMWLPSDASDAIKVETQSSPPSSDQSRHQHSATALVGCCSNPIKFSTITTQR